MNKKIIFILIVLMFCAFTFLNNFNNYSISNDGVKIYHKSYGEGDVNLILVHGWSNSSLMWNDQIPELSKKYTVTTIDLAGFGKSGNNRKNWTIDSFGNDIVAVANGLKLNNIIIAGFSMGGTAAIDATKKLKDRVIGTVIIDVLQDIELKFSDEQIKDIVESSKVKFTNKSLIKKHFTPDVDSTIVNKYIEQTFDQPKIGWWKSINGFFDWWQNDSRDTIKKIKTPIYHLNSAKTETNTEAFKKYSTNYHLKTISSKSHYLMWEKPKEFNSTLIQIIKEIERNGKN